MNPYLLAAATIFVFMVLMFIIATLLKKNSVVDAGWGIGFILVAAVTMLQNHPALPKQRLIMFLIVLWGCRLASYIAIRNWGKPEDYRYADMRRRWGKDVTWRAFLQIFMLQGAIMFIVALPIIVINSTPRTDFSDWLYGIGVGLWVIGFFTESLADHQMFFFKEDPHHEGKIMDKGLWKYSRHPNYFGEALQWWGVFVIAIPSGMWYVSIISPIVITFLLLKVSGVALLEQKYDGNDKYAEYKRKTSAFIPWFPKQ